jgi:hypothetical protein
VSEMRRALAAMDDRGLEGALRDLSTAISYPGAGAAGLDIATRVRQRIVDAPPASSQAPRGPLAWLRDPPIRRSTLVAIAALLVLAAVAGAVVLGVPGIRIQFGGPTPPPSLGSPSAPASAVGEDSLGQALGLGTRLPIEEAARLAGVDLVLPTDPSIGPPAGAFLLMNRVALVWPERPDLPADPATGVGLLISQFRGDVDEGYYQKTLDSDAQVTPVMVNGHLGYWIDGPPHFFYYVDPSGRPVDDSHRIVGDTLIWSDGEVTYRIESRLGMEAAIRLAESLR